MKKAPLVFLVSIALLVFVLYSSRQARSVKIKKTSTTKDKVLTADTPQTDINTKTSEPKEDTVTMLPYSPQHEEGWITDGLVHTQLYTEKIRFFTCTSDIIPKDTVLLNQLVATLRLVTSTNCIVCGCIDTTDHPLSSYRQSTLSLDRGNEIMSYLTRHGIAEDRIKVWVSVTDYPQSKQMRIEIANRPK